VVVSWPQAGYAPPPTPVRSLRVRVAGVAGVLLIAAGIIALGVAVAAQVHAPQPSASAAGAIGSSAHGPSLPRSLPVAVDIPAIGVDSKLLHLGLNSDGTIQVPSLETSSGEAAWYKYSATPGQIGSSVIEGHVDSYQGAAVFYRLGALRPGDTINVTLADGITAIFRVTGVREYVKSRFPAKAIYGDPLRRLAPDNLRRRFRLRHRPLPQFHGRIRVPDLLAAGPRPGQLISQQGQLALDV
jgi:hypothetical protein